MREELEAGQIKFEGITYSKGAFSCLVLARDQYDNILWARGTAKPTDGEAGFAVGCLFTDTDDGKPYFNIGTATTCNFDTPTLA